MPLVSRTSKLVYLKQLKGCSDETHKSTLSLINQYGLVVSMSRKGNCWDNAVATLKKELIYHGRYPSRKDASSSIFEYIEVFYNRQRLHSTLGYICPEEYERMAS